MKMNPVVHFEMPAEDRQRMVDFYSKAFGWKTQMMGAQMGEYVVVTTTESDEKSGRPKTPGSINGGFYKKGSEPSQQYPSVVIAVEDLDASIKIVKDAGGKVEKEPVEIPGIGRYVNFTDTEGNYVSMLQPKGM